MSPLVGLAFPRPALRCARRRNPGLNMIRAAMLEAAAILARSLVVP
jgi:hypothetical protein